MLAYVSLTAAKKPPPLGSVKGSLLTWWRQIPGLLHAWYIIAKVPDDYDYQRVPDTERGQHHVIIIHGDSRQQPQAQQPQRQPKPQHQNGMDYGTAHNGGNTSSSSTTAAQAGSSTRNEHQPAPPTYAEAVKGDHKIQTNE